MPTSTEITWVIRESKPTVRPLLPGVQTPPMCSRFWVSIGMTRAWASPASTPLNNIAANVIGLALGVAARFWLFRALVFRRPIKLGDIYPAERTWPVDPGAPVVALATIDTHVFYR